MRTSFLALAGAGLLAAVAVPATARAEDAKHGRELFMSAGCYECHGMAGQGSVQSGPRLAPEPMPVASMITLVRKPLNQMPAYSQKQLSDADVADIHAYLASIPAPPPVKDIPLLNY